jgi:hypothetical protein
MFKIILKLILFCFVMLTLASCTITQRVSLTYKLNDGAGLPKEKIALLFKDAFNHWVDIIEIDGKTPPKDPDDPSSQGSQSYGSMSDGSFIMELLPGAHTMKVEYENNIINFKSKGASIFTFTVEAGNVYKVLHSADRFNHTWKVWVEKTDNIPKNFINEKAPLYY